MIASDTLDRQMRRLARLRDFPDCADALRDLSEALLSAPDDSALEAWVTGWIIDSEFAPRPAEVYREFQAPLEYYQRPPLEPICKRCDDTGWEIVEKAGITGARKCACRANRRHSE